MEFLRGIPVFPTTPTSGSGEFPNSNKPYKIQWLAHTRQFCGCLSLRPALNKSIM